MSYTPHTWVNNETITAEKLNNIEDGVQEAAQSGGGIDALIYRPNSTVGDQVVGDFDAALAKVQQGIPLVAMLANYSEFSGGFYAGGAQFLGTEYNSSTPNQINLMITGGVGYHWTASGVEYYD